MLTPAQREERRMGIGGSDASAVLGVNPYRAPIDVYLDKLGLALPWDGNEATRWGDLLEPVIAAEYSTRTGLETARTDRVVRHPQHRWMLGNPDRIIVGASKGVEIKTAGVRSLHRWGEGPEECPEEYIVQCAWYMAVCGCDEWDLVALLGGQSLRIYTIKRDRELEGLMIEAAERFWIDHVLARVPPPPDGSESFKIYLASKYPRDVRPLRSATAEEEEAGEELKAKKSEAEDLDLEITGLENRIKSSMEDAAGIFWPGGKITWKADKNGRRAFRTWF